MGEEDRILLAGAQNPRDPRRLLERAATPSTQHADATEPEATLRETKGANVGGSVVNFPQHEHEQGVNEEHAQEMRGRSPNTPPNIAVSFRGALVRAAAAVAALAAMSKQPVRVVIRNRPAQESSANITMEKDGRTVTIRQSSATVGGGAKQELLSFSCDAVLDNASQETVFEEVARPICDAVLDGFNGTIMCYGQTGAGKSFSMVGDGQDYQLRGIAPRAFGLIFREMGNRPEWVYTARISFLEIYNENLYDLLATLPEFGPRTELSLLSDGRSGVPVKGLRAAEVKSEEEALRYLFEAESNRAVAQHALNRTSSRSHALYMVQIERRSRMHSSGTLRTTPTLTITPNPVSYPHPHPDQAHCRRRASPSLTWRGASGIRRRAVSPAGRRSTCRPPCGSSSSGSRSRRWRSIRASPSSSRWLWL